MGSSFFLGKPVSLPLFTHLDAVLLPFAVEALGFRSLSEGLISYYVL